jgi:hypothetical protein
MGEHLKGQTEVLAVAVHMHICCSVSFHSLDRIPTTQESVHLARAECAVIFITVWHYNIACRSCICVMAMWTP